jgi:3-methyladenine DNA glycosylase AlkD
VLRSVAKHSPHLAKAVVNSGALDALVNCLEEFDPSVKEAAALALSCIAKHNHELAQAVVDAGAVGLLVLCVQEPELTLKRISATALGEIAKHTEELAQAVVDQGAVPYLAALISHPDAQLKRYVCQCLAQIAKHTVDLAEVVVEAEIFPRILNCLKDMDVQVRKNAATCIREIAKQTTELAKLIVHSGGAAATVDYISESKGNARLPGIMTLGYISAFDDSLAMAVIVSKGIAPLKDALINEPEDHLKAAAAWSLGQIGRHSPDHAKFLAEADVPSRLLAVYMLPESSKDLKDKSKKSLKNIIQMCTHLPALEPLLQLAPNNILTYVCAQFAKVLPQNLEAKRTFVQSGGFQKIQEI